MPEPDPNKIQPPPHLREADRTWPSHGRYDQELADEVARRLDGVSQDVRDAIRVARLAPQLGIDKAIKLLLGG